MFHARGTRTKPSQHLGNRFTSATGVVAPTPVVGIGLGELERNALLVYVRSNGRPVESPLCDSMGLAFSAAKFTVASLHMIDRIPSSIELSPTQREILGLIIQDQASTKGPAEPEHVILLWSEGVSESVTAKKLGINKKEVKTLRYRWWASTARLAAAEKKLHKTFNDLTSLIFRIPNEETQPEPASNSPEGGVKTSSAIQGNRLGQSAD